MGSFGANLRPSIDLQPGARSRLDLSARGVSDFCGGDALMRREVLEAVRGSPAADCGEEPEMCSGFALAATSSCTSIRPMTGTISRSRTLQYWRRAGGRLAYAEVSTRFADSELRLWRIDARRNRSIALAILSAALAVIAGAILSGRGCR